MTTIEKLPDGYSAEFRPDGSIAIYDGVGMHIATLAEDVMAREIRRMRSDQPFAAHDAEPAAEPERDWLQPDALESIIDAYVANYDWIGEDATGADACHTPSERERVMLKDAMIGILADPEWDAEWGRHIDSLVAERAQLAAGQKKP
jgi:hypothetical protein